jgi:serine/threonine-protein kinase
MMAKKPENRYQTARDLLRDLARLRQGLSNATAEAPELASASVGQAVVAPVVTSTKSVRKRVWLPLAFGMSLLLAATGGAGVGWLRLAARSRPEGFPSADSKPVEAHVAPQEREQFLRNAIGQYANPGSDHTRIRLGIGHGLELALLYLGQWRLDEAYELFERYSSSPVEQYSTFGRLGRATVLGLQNRPVESNALFLEVVSDPRRQKQPRQALSVADSPQFAQWVARALEFNVANAPAEFPDQLKPLRSPPPAHPAGPGQRPGSGKTAGKGK